MKIGIITFWKSEDNYGQQLQCFALQNYLRRKGHDAFLIRYDMDVDYKKTHFLIRVFKAFDIRRVVAHINNHIYRSKIANENLEHPRHFAEFRNRYIKQTEHIYNSWTELKSSPPEADMYIVGSDQVWNPNCICKNFSKMKDRIHVFFLDFGSNKVKRVSYAASWSIKKIPTEYKVIISPLLKKFDYVSVREKNGVNLCSECGINNAKWLCDPTFLISPSEYRKIYKTAKYTQKPIKPYILFYYLNNDTFKIESLYAYAQKRNLDVVYISGNSQIDLYSKVYPSVEEWLYLVDNASYIVTNSFHCAVFSILFHKLFGVIQINGKSKDMNERIENLFSLCGIKPRYCTDSDYSILKEDYSTKINDFAEIGKGFLEKITSTSCI